MQANISLILNVILLIGVIAAISYVIRSRRSMLITASPDVPLAADNTTGSDDIIAVRKIETDLALKPALSPRAARTASRTTERTNPITFKQSLQESDVRITKRPARTTTSKGQHVMLFLAAKADCAFTGYELLQTLLATGLRFGESNLFHRHQHANGQGPILCSLANASASGTFDLQNIGALSTRGLCLFMETSGNTQIDAERFDIMMETGKQLRDSLDAYLLDHNKHPL